MALEPARLTKHEHGVMIAALRDYATKQHTKARVAAKAETRARSGANEYVAGDLIRQLIER